MKVQLEKMLSQHVTRLWTKPPYSHLMRLRVANAKAASQAELQRLADHDAPIAHIHVLALQPQ